MATLDDIDMERAIKLCPYQHDLDQAETRPIEQVTAITLTGPDVATFMAWALHWRQDLERDLQCISEDREGRPLLTTWMPLVTFRESFCGGGRQMQEPAIQDLMERLRLLTRTWRQHEVDTVDIISYRRFAALNDV